MSAFRDVTKDDFWRFVMTTTRNVHPRPERDQTVWEDLRTREVVAIVTPGYLLDGPETYRLAVGVASNA